MMRWEYSEDNRSARYIHNKSGRVMGTIVSEGFWGFHGQIHMFSDKWTTYDLGRYDTVDNAKLEIERQINGLEGLHE